MAERRRLLVLANSAKTGGRCLAGKFVEQNERGVWVADGWCRPVLPDGNGHDAMPSGACDQFNPLDVIQIDLDGPLPSSGQPENWRWQVNTAISLETTLNQTRNSVAPLAESPADLWLDPPSGRPDEVRSTYAVRQSLYLVQAQDLWLHLSIDLTQRKRIHAEFRYNGHLYEHIPVTDPIILRILSRQFPNNGQTTRMQLKNRDNYWLTLSISLPFGPRNARYKFVAAIIDHTGYLQRTYR